MTYSARCAHLSSAWLDNVSQLDSLAGENVELSPLSSIMSTSERMARSVQTYSARCAQLSSAWLDKVSQLDSLAGGYVDLSSNQSMKNTPDGMTRSLSEEHVSESPSSATSSRHKTSGMHASMTDTADSNTQDDCSNFVSGDGFGAPQAHTTSSHRAVSDPSVSETQKRLRSRALLRTLKEVGQALLHFHAMGVVHGDMKPANILLIGSRADRRGFIAQVIDFGLSSVLANTVVSAMSGSTKGTLEYM
eukprot:gene9174-16305_t